MTSALVAGTVVAALPVGCASVVVGGVAYQQCGATWYRPQYVGTSVQYVIVSAPR